MLSIFRIKLHTNIGYLVYHMKYHFHLIVHQRYIIFCLMGAERGDLLLNTRHRWEHYTQMTIFYFLLKVYCFLFYGYIKLYNR